MWKGKRFENETNKIEFRALNKNALGCFSFYTYFAALFFLCSLFSFVEKCFPSHHSILRSTASANGAAVAAAAFKFCNQNTYFQAKNDGFAGIFSCFLKCYGFGSTARLL